MAEKAIRPQYPQAERHRMQFPAQRSQELHHRFFVAAMTRAVEQRILFQHVANHAQAKSAIAQVYGTLGKRALPIADPLLLAPNQPALGLERIAAAHVTVVV